MYLLLLVFGGLLAAAGVILTGSGMSLRDGTFDAAILTPGIVAAAGGLLLIGLGAGLRTLQRIERTLASRPMPRATPIAESAKTADTAATPQPVRIPFVPKLSEETQAGVAARDSLDAKSLATAAAAGKGVPPVAAIPLAVPEAIDAQRSSKNGNGAAGIRTGLRLPSSLRRASASERQSEPALDALWPKGPRPSRAVEASLAPVAPQGSNVMPIQSQQTADVAPAPASNPDAAISILKSGVVNGMPYTLYSDGSIEAKLAEGTLRFGSITELRNHIEQSA